MASLTLAYSNHRPETLQLAAELMQRHEVVLLEDPPDPNFYAMLRGEYAIDDYVSQLDTEYPEFSHQSFRLFRELRAEGLKFYQVEPFLEQLIQIHQMFAEGLTPADIPHGSSMMAVYSAEKNATQALIQYYAAAAKGTFHEVLEALKNFARRDAERFRLRDRMRAHALLKTIQAAASVYIEAGTMHLWLRKVLKRRLQWNHRIKCHHLTAPQTKALTGRSVLMGPGDALTGIYIFNPNTKSLHCDRLAARSLIFNKIVNKEEKIEGQSAYPHLRAEWRAVQATQNLTMSDCAALFAKLRFSSTEQANACVAEHLVKHCQTKNETSTTSKRTTQYY